MRTAVINQPNYLPTPHYFEQIARADVFVFYDDVQYTRGDWRNRNRIRTPKGWQWLTVPVLNRAGQRINEARIDNHTDWAARHMKAIEANYSKAPYFGSYWIDLMPMYSRKWDSLRNLDVEMVYLLCDLLGMSYSFLLSSRLGIEGEGGDKTGRLVEICELLGADTYYSPAGSREYLDVNMFGKAGITVEFQDYKHPEYPQLYNPFMPYLSVIDLLFNCGEGSLKIITSGGRGGKGSGGKDSHNRSMWVCRSKPVLAP